ncbi:MAG: HAD-IIIA family hydrolase [bacterium]|nr:HAD-IIIA family hydrolase [bacterium]
MTTPKPMLLLDIDGTVREGKDDALGRFVNTPDDVRVFPAAVDRMRQWRDLGGRIVGVSNQGGIALGILDFSTVQAAMKETQRQAGGLFDRIVFCRHHPKADDLLMARCWCRKPLPGGAIEAMNQLASQLSARGVDEMYPPHLAVMVGDRPEDEQMAEALNVRFLSAADWRDGEPYVETKERDGS